LYTVQKDAWFDETVMLEWIQRVLKPFVEEHANQATHVILDDFTAHKTAKVNNAIQRLGMTSDLVLPGFTAVLQPLDVGINKPFKDYYRNCCTRNATSQNPQKPGRPLVSQWIIDSWENISVETIQNAWTKSLTVVV
jgi:hypothetical protein